MPMRRIPVLLALLLAAACTAPAGDAVRSLPADADLDARSLGRGAANARPATVQRQDDPAQPAILFTVSPRLQTGSPASPPMVVTSLGAERQRATGATTYQALVIVSNARRHADFSRATTRQGTGFPLRTVSRQTDCGGAGGCLYVQTMLLTIPPEALRQAAEGNTGLRLRLDGSAAFVEAAIPAGHLRALLDATTPR